MKNIIPFTLLFIYLIQVIVPYSPYIDYYLNKDFIAENFCENKNKPDLKCYGKCYLKDQIVKQVEQTTVPDESLPTITLEKEPVHYIKENQWHPTNTTEMIKDSDQTTYLFFLTEFIAEIVPPPPKG